MGHEFVGKVEKIGNAVTALCVGDRVVAQPHLHACGKCDACVSGAPQSCEHRRSLGISRDGAMAEYVVIPAMYLHVIPSSIPDKFATLIEPMTIVVSDLIVRGKFIKGETLAIIGAGQIAQLAVVAAKAADASQIIVIGQQIDSIRRFKSARALGADYTFNVEKDDIYSEVMRITKDKGVEMIFEASGSEQGINSAIDIVRFCGRMSLLGLSKRECICVDWDKMMKKMVNLQFNMSSDYTEIGRAIEIFSNPPCDLSPLISHESSIDDWENIFNELTLGNGIKAVLTFDQ
jgi:threonine dehydrogenase-like Zn-dependent dehydrogenase